MDSGGAYVGEVFDALLGEIRTLVGKLAQPTGKHAHQGSLFRLRMLEHCSVLGVPSSVTKLPRSFYGRDTVVVARDLLGKHLIHIARGVEHVGRIVEVEAYLGAHDLASHSAKGLTPRTRVMFGPPGYAYVYLIYGVHHCMNVVTECAGHGSAVLIRAVEPVRNLTGRTCGPGLLCKAMGIDLRLNAQDLLGNELFIIPPSVTEPIRVVRRPRIGVDYAGHWAKKRLRFYIRGSAFVSRSA